jgi:hypothetical protein
VKCLTSAQLLLPLIVSDLPAVLWCRCPRIFSGEPFAPLLPWSRKSSSIAASAVDPQAAIAAIRELRKQGRLVADLSWTKLTGLRELMAGLFDEGTAVGIKSAKVFYGLGTFPRQLHYFAVRDGAHSPRSAVELKRGEGPRGLRTIILSGDICEITITRPDRTTLEVHCGGRIRRSTMALLSEEVLMSEELSILGPDPIFDKVLA